MLGPEPYPESSSSTHPALMLCIVTVAVGSKYRVIHTRKHVRADGVQATGMSSQSIKFSVELREVVRSSPNSSEWGSLLIRAALVNLLGR